MFTGRIDVHGHMVAPQFIAATKEMGYTPAVSGGFPDWTDELALEFMDHHGIAVTVNSISPPGMHFVGDADKAYALARQCNDELARLVAKYPKKFGALAVTPLPDVDRALKEIERAYSDLNVDGVGLLASYGTDFLGDKIFDPVLELLNEKKATVFLHPTTHPTSRNLGMTLPRFLVEFPIDTARCVANLIFSDALDRYPDIKFILAHNGGAVAALAWRLQMGPLIDTRLKHITGDKIEGYFRRFFYDSAQACGAGTMAAVMKIGGSRQILFGSDWPYCPPSVTQAGDRSIEAQAATGQLNLAEFYRENALRLFPRFT